LIHLHISATAPIAHKVTKKVNFVAAFFPYSAPAALNLTLHDYSNYHLKACRNNLTALSFAKVANYTEVVACN
jgi:hypothetical protein